MMQTTLWEKLTISVLWIFITFQASLGQDRKDQQLRFTGETKVITPSELFKPLISFPSPELEKRMGSITLEGLRLPTLEIIIQQALPKEMIKEMLDDTIEWIERVLQPRWLIKNLSNHLYAVRKAVNQRDAFIGAWSSQGHIFQVVITQEHLHLITQTPPLLLTGNDQEKIKSVHTMASELFQLPKSLDPNNWWIESPNGFLIGAPRINTYDRDWEETLVFLVQGTGIKLSIEKQMNAGDPPQRIYPPPKVPPPWFPPTRTKRNSGLSHR